MNNEWDTQLYIFVAGILNLSTLAWLINWSIYVNVREPPYMDFRSLFVSLSLSCKETICSRGLVEKDIVNYVCSEPSKQKRIKNTVLLLLLATNYLQQGLILIDDYTNWLYTLFCLELHAYGWSFDNVKPSQFIAQYYSEMNIYDFHCILLLSVCSVGILIFMWAMSIILDNNGGPVTKGGRPAIFWHLRPSLYVGGDAVTPLMFRVHRRRTCPPLRISDEHLYR